MSSTEQIYDEAVVKLDEYLAANRMRRTPERYTILRQICKFPAQFTAEQLRILCSDELTIARATVYNTIQLFLDAGILLYAPRYAGSKEQSYELNFAKESVLMFHCTSCGRESTFSDKSVTTSVMMHRYSNFVPGNYTLNVFGVCKHCRSKRMKELIEQKRLEREGKINN